MYEKRKLIIFILIVTCLIILTNYGCNNKENIEDIDELEDVVTVDENDTIIIHYNERDPYQVTSDGKVTGIIADPVNLVFEKAGLPYKWIKTPAVRMMAILENNDGPNCLVGWFKNPDREKIAKYTYVIYQDLPTVAIARSDNNDILDNQIIKDVLMNEELTLLVKDGYSYGSEVDNQITEYAKSIISTTSENIEMLKMIHSNRADYFFIAEEEVTPLLNASGFSSSDFKLIHFSDMPLGNKRYILLSLNIDDEILDRLNAAITEYLEINNEK